jgi:uncharacterized protein involved in outer membrane biogenesis
MRWKWILGILAGVILTALIVILILVSTYDFNKFKPRIGDIAKEYTGRKLTIGGDIGLTISLYPTLVVNDITFQNADWGSRPHLASVENIEVQVALLPLLRGKVQVEKLHLVKPDAIIEINPAGKSNVAFEVAAKPGAEAIKEESEPDIKAFFGFEDISVTDGMVTLYDHRDQRKDIFAVKEFVGQAADFAAEPEIRFVGVYNDFPIKVEGTIGSIYNLLDATKKWDLNLSAQAFETNFTITGAIIDVINVTGLDLEIVARGKDLASFENIIKKPLPVKGPFNVSGHLVAATRDQFKLSDISLLLGKSKISGSAAVDQSAKKPRLKANLFAETLDLRAVIDQSAKQASGASKDRPATEKRSDKVFADSALQLDGLQQVNAHIDFKAKQILLPKLALDNFQTRVVLKDGHLSVNPIDAHIGGGKLNSRLDLKAQGNLAAGSMKLNLKKLDIDEMLKALDIRQDLEGVLDLDIDLTGQGNSVAALMAGLNGDVVVVLGDGKMPVKYLDLLGADFTSSLQRLLNPFSEKIDRATINCAVCDFHIVDGLAKTDVLMLDDPQKTLISDGKIDLKTERLNFGIKTKPKEGIGTQQTGKVSVSLSDITKPFKLGGTLARPSLELDVTGSAVTIGAALLGPAGWAYLLVSGTSGKKTPCEAAMEVAGQGTPKKTATSDGRGTQQTADKKEKESLGSKIKGLFSTEKDQE